MAPVISTLRYIGRHPLASRQPLRAYWRYARWQIESRLRREVEVNWICGAKLIATNGMTGATGNIYCGLHEFADMAFLLHILRPGDLFVDVGANVGSFTVLASAVRGARSLALEPDPCTAAHLRRNIAANAIGDLAKVIESAVGAERGQVRFTIGRDTTNQVIVNADEQLEGREVDIQPLDDLLQGEHPLLIKIDVEGYEANVLVGAQRVLDELPLQAVLIETVDAAILRVLQRAGFRKASYAPFTRCLRWVDGDGPAAGAANTLFVRNLEFCRDRVATAPWADVLGERF